MLSEIETRQGVFIRESKNRFLCEVMMDGEILECYVPSSSRMENYLSIENKEVLLTKNKTGGRTQYSLFAVKIKGKYIILNLNKINSILKVLIESNRFRAYKGFKAFIEKKTGDYKSDLLLCKTNEEIIVEVKGVISEEKTAIFPHVYTERGVRQLKQLKELLIQGKRVDYLLISLSPLVKDIKIFDGNQDYLRALNECLNNGMNLIAYKLIFDGKRIRLSSTICISELSIVTKVKGEYNSG